MALRYIDPNARRGWATTLMGRVGTNRFVNLVSRWIGWRLDPLLLRLTGGRVATTFVIPTTVLETTGARSGRRRRNAVIYFHDTPDRVIIAASHAGAEHNPGWFHNLKANAAVIVGGTPATAAEVDDETERRRLWSLADRVFPGYPEYRRRATSAGREIPLIALDLHPPTGKT